LALDLHLTLDQLLIRKRETSIAKRKSSKNFKMTTSPYPGSDTPATSLPSSSSSASSSSSSEDGKKQSGREQSSDGGDSEDDLLSYSSEYSKELPAVPPEGKLGLVDADKGTPDAWVTRDDRM